MDDTDDPMRERVIALVERARRARMTGDDPAAWRALYDVVLRRAILPVARRVFGREDERARDLAQQVFEKLMDRLDDYDPGRAGRRDGCAWFVRCAFNAALDMKGRKRLPARIARLADPPRSIPRARLEAFYWRCIIGGEPSHEVLARLEGPGGEPPTAATLDGQLRAVESAALSKGKEVARSLARQSMSRAAELGQVAPVGIPSVEQSLDRARHRLIGRALGPLIEARLDEHERFVVEWTMRGVKVSRIMREAAGRACGPCAARADRKRALPPGTSRPGDVPCALETRHAINKHWKSARATLRAALVERFGADTLDEATVKGFLGADGASPEEPASSGAAPDEPPDDPSPTTCRGDIR